MVLRLQTFQTQDLTKLAPQPPALIKENPIKNNPKIKSVNPIAIIANKDKFSIDEKTP